MQHCLLSWMITGLGSSGSAYLFTKTRQFKISSQRCNGFCADSGKPFSIGETDSRVQQPGESFGEFFFSLKEIAAFCDFCAVYADEHLRDRLVVGVSSEEARRRLLETAELTLQSAADICRAAENAANSRAVIAGPLPCLQKMSEYQRRRHGGRGGRASSVTRSQGRAAPTSRTGSSDRCSRCGAATHREGRPSPASGRTCFKCGNEDHFSSMCRSRGRSQSRRVSSNSLRNSSSVPGSKPMSLPDIHVRASCSSSFLTHSSTTSASTRWQRG